MLQIVTNHRCPDASSLRIRMSVLGASLAALACQLRRIPPGLDKTACEPACFVRSAFCVATFDVSWPTGLLQVRTLVDELQLRDGWGDTNNSRRVVPMSNVMLHQATAPGFTPESLSLVRPNRKTTRTLQWLQRWRRHEAPNRSPCLLGTRRHRRSAARRPPSKRPQSGESGAAQAPSRRLPSLPPLPKRGPPRGPRFGPSGIILISDGTRKRSPFFFPRVVPFFVSGGRCCPALVQLFCVDVGVHVHVHVASGSGSAAAAAAVAAAAAAAAMYANPVPLSS